MRQTRCVRAHALGHGLLMTSVASWLDSYVMALAAIGRFLQARARTVLQLVMQEYFLQLPVQPWGSTTNYGRVQNSLYIALVYFCT